MKLLVPLSGGKDSQATLHYCIEKFGVDKLTAVFCDTKWEHDLTYEHLNYLVEKTGVDYKILGSEKYEGFVDLCKKKKRFPSSQARFCTSELKVIPMINYILSLEDNVMIFQGIRGDESISRSEMSVECRYFKYYFEPYSSNEITIKKFKKNPPTTHKQKEKLSKAIERLAKGKNDEKYHTYRKKDVFAWCEKYVDDVFRPFFNATAEDVIYYALNRDYKINPLYFRGSSRVGCYPCIHSNQPEMQNIIEQSPETIVKVREAEKEIKGTFFAPDYIPKRYHRGFDPKSGKTICDIDDVVRYLADKNVQFDLVDDLGMGSGCNSVYAICE